MLERLTEDALERYASWAYQLAMSSEHASYPTWRDGIKNREDFMRRAQRGFQDEEILLYSHEGCVRGWIQWYALPAEKYAQTVSFLVEDHAVEAVREFNAYIQRRLPGYTLDIGMDAENTQVCMALEQEGFQCLDRSVNHTLFFTEYQPIRTPESVSLLTAEDEEDFRRLHDDPEAYWNADRILADRADWNIYMYRQNGRCRGTLVCQNTPDWPEIFSIDFAQHQFAPEVYQGLLMACLNGLKAAGAQHMTFFEEKAAALPFLKELGFIRVGEYRAYRMNV